MNRRISFVLMPALAIATLTATLPAIAQQTPEQKAADTFKTRCTACHGEKGEGTPVGQSLKAPDLRSEDVKKMPDADLHNVIKNGKNNMPPIGHDLSDDEVDQLIKLVRSFASDASQPPPAPSN